MISFGEWLPDHPSLGNPGATEAKNVIPGSSGYRQFSTPSSIATALTARCLGGAAFKDLNGNVFHYAGDASKLYRVYDSAPVDYSKSGGYSTQYNEKWRFVQWGNQVFATNYSDAIQEITMGGSRFADLSASAPRARHMAAVGNFLMLADTVDNTDGTVKNRLWWSAINDPTNWPTPGSSAAIAVQSDYQDIENGCGAINGIVGADVGYVFQERGVVRVSYTGDSNFFQLDNVEIGRGAVAPGPIVPYGRVVFYLAQDGFRYFNGVSSEPIGHNKIDRWFWNAVNTSYLVEMSGAVDPVNQCVFWAFPDASATSGTCNNIIVFHMPTGKWSRAVVDTERLVQNYTLGYSLDGLDAVSTNADTMTIPWDDASWNGGDPRIGCYDTSHRLCHFTGTPGTAVIETAEVELSPGMLTEVQSVRAYLEGAAANASQTLQVGTRAQLGDAVTWGSATDVGSDGEAKVRANARFHKFRANVTGAFTTAYGVLVTESAVTGRR